MEVILCQFHATRVTDHSMDANASALARTTVFAHDGNPLRHPGPSGGRRPTRRPDCAARTGTGERADGIAVYDASVLYAAVHQLTDSWRQPPGSVNDVRDRLERSGLAVSVAEVRAGRPAS